MKRHYRGYGAAQQHQRRPSMPPASKCRHRCQPRLMHMPQPAYEEKVHFDILRYGLYCHARKPPPSLLFHFSRAGQYCIFGRLFTPLIYRCRDWLIRHAALTKYRRCTSRDAISRAAVEAEKVHFMPAILRLLKPKRNAARVSERHAQTIDDAQAGPGSAEMLPRH